jgi:SAM-dependent methyltransferase
MSNFQNLIRRQAEIKFGADNEQAITKWVGYWTETLSRNFGLMEAFRNRTEINFQGKTVLDIGCGTGGLSKIVTEEDGHYIGSDFFPAILEIAQAFITDLPNRQNCALIRASGTAIPLGDESVDFVVAFDVIEHLEGGRPWQLSFLREICRVLRRNGILMLTTPNRLYPFEGHTFLYGPQYLPVRLADRYIRWKNPSFLQEYRTYGQVKLLNPWQMKRLVDQSGLKLVYDFPWETDLEDYRLRRLVLMRILSGIGLGWVPTSTFWFTACRNEDWGTLRTLRKNQGQRRKYQWLRDRLMIH